MAALLELGEGLRSVVGDVDFVAVLLQGKLQSLDDGGLIVHQQ